MTIAITGGSGFIGRQLVEKLCGAGYAVRALVHSSSLLPHKTLSVVQGSLHDERAITELLQGADAVIHCAGAVAAKNAEEFHRINAEGTALVGRIALQNGVERFLLISSIAAKAPHVSPYATSKKAAEEVLGDFPDLPWDVMRPPAVYGPEDLNILPLFRFLKHGMAIIPPTKNARLSFIYRDDVVDAIWTWLDKTKKPTHAVYEIDGGRDGGYSWREFLGQAAEIMVVDPRYIRAPRPLLYLIGYFSQLVQRRPFLSTGKISEMLHDDWVCDSHDFCHATGWVPQTDLKLGLAQSIAWYRDKGLL